MCDGVQTYQSGGPDGPVLLRGYWSDGSGTSWYVGPSDRLNACSGNSYMYDFYLYSAVNPGRPGGAPTAPGYSAGDGWYDGDNNAHGTITVTAGDGSAIGGGGGH